MEKNLSYATTQKSVKQFNVTFIDEKIKKK